MSGLFLFFITLGDSLGTGCGPSHTPPGWVQFKTLKLADPATLLNRTYVSIREITVSLIYNILYIVFLIVVILYIVLIQLTTYTIH